METNTVLRAALERARRYSRYAERLLVARPELEQAPFDAPFDRAAMSAAIAHHDDPAAPTDGTLGRALRLLRQEVMLRLIVRDLGGLADLAEVTRTMSELADVALDAALAHVEADLGRDYGVPRNAAGVRQQLHVVGMGKLGGHELNVSSDIDLILLYPEDGETDGARVLSNHEYFTRAARRMIGALAELTEHGFVFRVDTRLRPYGDSGPLVMSFDMLENYLITQGREWERYAWIKGRAVTGDRGAELMELVRPFVFRRHLDYSAFSSMRDLHQQVRREVARRDIADNIKLGPGGIREIEFIVQAFQLIRGGRDAALRTRPTLEVLARLGERGLLPATAVGELQAAYVFLRNLEHRLQYRDDQQTHRLPEAEADRLAVAREMGLEDLPAFDAALAAHRAQVSAQFGAVFSGGSTEEHPLATLWQDAEAADTAIEKLDALGFRSAKEVQQRMAAMRRSSRYRDMPSASQARLDRLVPLTIETARTHRNPDATLERMLQLLESVSRREAYLALLEQYPEALKRVAELMSASPWVAQYLTRHPILLDELLDPRTLYAAPDWAQLTATLRRDLGQVAGDIEREMDVLRHFKQTQTIRLVAQDLAGTLPLEPLSDHLSDLACILLREVTRLVWGQLRQRHRDEPAFAIVAYGKLGGKELGYASDLDLVFLYDDPAPDAPENYARLAQRINHWLTSMTAAGTLYETDLRLRPDGVSGLLVSPLASFREYQTKNAWAWEHQALTRARFVAGDARIGEAFEALRTAVLRAPRDRTALKEEIRAMRGKMLDGHPNPSPLFDLKHDPGGIIDVEFIVQYLVLGHACDHAELTGNIGNLALLKLAARLGLIAEPAANAAHAAYRRFRQLQHSLRLQGEAYARVPVPEVRAEASAVRSLWTAIFGTAPPRAG